MKVTYYLNEGRKKNLYCRINDGKERVTFSLEYALEKKEWDPRSEMVKSENEYFFTLSKLKKYLIGRYEELKGEDKDSVLEILKNEALSLMKDTGMDGIAENLFDYYNRGSNVPLYNSFVQAFEQFKGLKKGEYKTETIDSLIHFHVGKKVYEMDTYEGKTSRLKFFIKNKSYDEIYTETSEMIWNEMFLNAGISKNVFFPKLLSEWESYWDEKYKKVKEKIGRTDHLDSGKDASWRGFQVFMECYDHKPDTIELACEINDSVFFPLSVIVLLNIIDEEVCYDDYCEYEFFDKMTWEWESIRLKNNDDDDDDENDKIFFIREYND